MNKDKYIKVTDHAVERFMERHMDKTFTTKSGRVVSPKNKILEHITFSDDIKANETTWNGSKAWRVLYGKASYFIVTEEMGSKGDPYYLVVTFIDTWNKNSMKEVNKYFDNHNIYFGG